MIESIVDQPIRLAELMAPALFAELCTSHANLWGVGVKVVDRAHTVLADVAKDRDLTTWLFQFKDAWLRYADFVTSLRRQEVDLGGVAVLQDPVLGSRFLLLPVVYEFEVLGKVVCGPYLGDDMGLETPLPSSLPDGMDRDELAALRAALPRWSDEGLRARVRLLLSAIDVVCHAGYQTLLTGKLHLESITTAYNDLQLSNAQLAAANAELLESNQRLVELDELKSNFLATVSHELRTPLTSVIGYSEMLLEGLAGEVNPEQREYISTIMERGENLLQLISGILDISRIEQGAQKLLVDKVDPRELIEETLTTVRPQALRSGAKLEHVVSADVGPVHMDRYKMRQALLNLVSNAIKFTPAGGRIVVSASLRPALDGAESALQLSVSDTGIGIPADHQAKVFEAFHQVDNSSTREYGGTGLGLSIVKSFVESHGGTITLESSPHAGSTFTLTIPLNLARK